jgi:glutaredoxin
MSSNKLIIFTLETCGACRLLKKKLKQNKIEFLEIDIDEYPELWDKVVEQTKIDYVPTSYIIKDNENEGLIFSPGQDYEDVDDLIKKILDNLQ